MRSAAIRAGSVQTPHAHQPRDTIAPGIEALFEQLAPDLARAHDDGAADALSACRSALGLSPGATR